jgi:pimeloyl-ACP methyl ester carboxylesterase
VPVDDGVFLWTATGGAGSIPVVHGSRDPRPLSALEAMLAALPRAELVVMDGVGHLPWLEDSVSFARIACEFVTRAGVAPQGD